MKSSVRVIAVHVLALFAIILGPAKGLASTYYVSPTGADTNSGATLSLSWRTLTKAAAVAGIGDTVLIADGDYDGGVVMRQPGIAGLPVTFRAINPGAAKVHGENTTATDAILVQANYVVIDGLYISKANRAAIRVDQANHVTVRRCICVDNVTWGIFTDYSDDLLIELNECAFSHTQHGIYVSNSGDRPIVRFNLCHDNLRAGIQINADASLLRPDLGKRGDGITENAVCSNNIIYNCGADGAAGINLASVRTSLIANNLIYNCVAGGIALWDDGDGSQWGCKDNRIINNTIYFRAPEGRHPLSFTNGSTGNVVLNNVIYGGQRCPYEVNGNSSFTADHNLLFWANGTNVVEYSDLLTGVNLASWQTSSGNDLNSVFADPWLSNTSADPFDFHLIDATPGFGIGIGQKDVLFDLSNAPMNTAGPIHPGCYQTTVATTAPVAPTFVQTLPGNRNLTITWAPTARTTYYNIKRARTVAGPYTIVGTSLNERYLDQSLTNGTMYYYKISAANVAGTSPDSTAASGMPQDLPSYAYAVHIFPRQVSGTLPSVGTIEVSSPAPAGGLTFTLTSSNSAVASTVPSITIPEGSKTGTFPISTFFVNKWTWATFTAQLGIMKRQLSVLVTPPNLQGATTNSPIVVGGTPAVVTFMLDAPAGPKGRQIQVNVDPGLSPATQLVTIPAGKRSVNVTLQTDIVTVPTDCAVAGYDFQNYVGALVTLVPLLSDFTVNPTTTYGGLTAVGTVVIGVPAPAGGVVVNLASSLAGTSVPATLTIPEGAVSADFNVVTTPVAAISTTTLTVTYGATSLSTTLTVKPLALSSFTLDTSTVLGGFGAVGTATITAPAPPGGLTLTVTSSLAAASVPATVTIPEGATSASFNITTVPVSVSGTATITVKFSTSSMTAPLAVKALAASTSLNPTSVNGGASSTATVTLVNPAPAGGLTLNLSSSLAGTSVPATLFIAEGATTGTFTVSTSPVAANGSSTVSAKYGPSSFNATLAVKAPTALSLVLNPATVKGGVNSTGTFTLSGNAPTGGTKVNVTSNNVNATVPATITVPAGSNSVTFTITTKAVTVNTNVTINAGGKTATLKLTP